MTATVRQAGPVSGRERWSAGRLAGVAVVLALLVAGIGLLTVDEGPWWLADQRWSRRVFDGALDRPWLADAADWFGAVTIPSVLRVITLVGAFVLWRRGDRATAIWWAVTMIVVGAMAIAVRYAVARPRPQWPGGGGVEEGYTFPSGHATSAAGFALCILIVFWPRLQARGRAALATGAAVLAIGVAASRVMIGVHRISDVLAAWALAGAVVAACLAVASAVAARRAVSTDRAA